MLAYSTVIIVHYFENTMTMSMDAAGRVPHQSLT